MKLGYYSTGETISKYYEENLRWIWTFFHNGKGKSYLESIIFHPKASEEILEDIVLEIENLLIGDGGDRGEGWYNWYYGALKIGLIEEFHNILEIISTHPNASTTTLDFIAGLKTYSKTHYNVMTHANTNEEMKKKILLLYYCDSFEFFMLHFDTDFNRRSYLKPLELEMVRRMPNLGNESRETLLMKDG